MVRKRPFPTEDGKTRTDGSDSDADEDELPFPLSQRRRTVESQRSMTDFLEALKQWFLNEFVTEVVPLLRTAVREEVQFLVKSIEGNPHQSRRPTPVLQSHTGTSGVKKFQLRFLNQVPKSIFTQAKIAAEDGTPLKIALFDIRSESIIDHGPFSCLSVDLHVLCGDFGSNDDECSWTNHEFLASVVSERRGKRPLLDGNAKIKLQGGVGEIGEISLTDNSKWMKNAMFKLGVMSGGMEEIQGGLSGPFRVKDRRGESYEKHDPPLLDDPIWRLEKIAKEGPYDKQLSAGGIKHVKDLLRLRTTDPSALAKTFEGIPKRTQDTIMRHASKCVVNDSVSYLYEIAEPPTTLFFNSIYKLVKVTFDRQHFLSPQDLTSDQKAMVEIAQELAYLNLENLVSVDQISTISVLNPKELPVPQQNIISGQDLQQFYIPFDHFCCNFLPSSSYSLAENSVYFSPGQDLQQFVIPFDHNGMHLNPSYPSTSTAHLVSESTDEEISLESWARMNAMLPSSSQVLDVPLGSIVENCNQHFQLSNCFPASAIKGSDNIGHFSPYQAAGFDVFASCPGASAHIMRTDATKYSWTAILAVVKWVRSVKRNVGTKAKLLCYNG